MTLDAAWARCEAALPDGWDLELKGGWRFGRPPSEMAAGTQYMASANGPSKGRGRAADFEMAHGSSPIAALTALAEALEARSLAGTPKP